MPLLSLAGKLQPISNYPWPGWFVIPVTFLQGRGMDHWKKNPQKASRTRISLGFQLVGLKIPPAWADSSCRSKLGKGVVAEGQKELLKHRITSFPLFVHFSLLLLFFLCLISLLPHSPLGPPPERRGWGVWLIGAESREVASRERDHLTPDSFHSNRDRLVGGVGR